MTVSMTKPLSTPTTCGVAFASGTIVRLKKLPSGTRSSVTDTDSTVPSGAVELIVSSASPMANISSAVRPGYCC